MGEQIVKIIGNKLYVEVESMVLTADQRITIRRSLLNIYEVKQYELSKVEQQVSLIENLIEEIGK